MWGFTASDWITIVSIIVTIVGVVIAISQKNANNADIINNVHNSGVNNGIMANKISGGKSNVANKRRK